MDQGLPIDTREAGEVERDINATYFPFVLYAPWLEVLKYSKSRLLQNQSVAKNRTAAVETGFKPSARGAVLKATEKTFRTVWEKYLDGVAIGLDVSDKTPCRGRMHLMSSDGGHLASFHSLMIDRLCVRSRTILELAVDIFESHSKQTYPNLFRSLRKRRSRPIRKGLAWGLQSVDQRVCKSLAGGMEAATTENYEVRPNDQGRSSSIRDCG
ncbi:hypothetical protein [Bradyrhizobium diazoefficiens]